MTERIKCCHCSSRVAVIVGERGWKFARHPVTGKPCKGSGQTIRGNWRDDPTYVNDQKETR